MGFLDAIFGGTRLSRPRTERFFALATAGITLEEQLGWKHGGRAGLCLKPVTTGDFQRTKSELTDLMRLAARDTATTVEVVKDEYGYLWIVLADPDFEDLVNLVHMAAQTIQEHGYGGQLLSAIFRFSHLESQFPVYLIYNYKRGSFYPFAPMQTTKPEPKMFPSPTIVEARDNSLELRVGAVMERELPMEKDLTRWYPLWDCPV